MKSFIYLGLLMLFSFQTKENQHILSSEFNNIEFEIFDMKGDLKDIENFFYLDSTKLCHGKRGIKIKYVDELQTIYFTINEKLLAYYHVAVENDSIFINNYSALRGSVSYINIQERKFLVKFKIKEEKNSEVSSYNMQVFNSPYCRHENKLKDSILIAFISKD